MDTVPTEQLTPRVLANATRFLAVDAVQKGTEPQLLSGALARDALRLCYAEAKSITT